MLKVARRSGLSHAVAQEVVQDTWVRVLSGLDRFQERSSLRTWLFAILINCARRGADRERRTVPFSAVADGDGDFERAELLWPARDAGQAEAPEARSAVRTMVGSLPPVQRAVVVLRDVEGWDSEDVCRVLRISPGNQRVLLHRARARLREQLGGARAATV
jgi:RNA polymerase sigma-70 factor (ECF subfamily)